MTSAPAPGNQFNFTNLNLANKEQMEGSSGYKAKQFIEPPTTPKKSFSEAALTFQGRIKKFSSKKLSFVNNFKKSHWALPKLKQKAKAVIRTTSLSHIDIDKQTSEEE